MTTQIRPSSEQLSFKLPREHGAVVVFSLACIVSLLLCRADPIIMVVCELVFWAMMMSLHHPRQLFLIAFLSMLALQLLSGSILAVWIGVVWLGAQTTMWSPTGKIPWWKEALGVSGACLAPLVVSLILTGEPALHSIVALSLLASIFTGSGLVRASRKDVLGDSLRSALLALLLWVCLALASPMTAALSLIPYVAQSAWLAEVTKPSFKQLGQVQCLCLLWVGVVIALRIFERI